MAGRVAIDFGTANTVIANWDNVRQQGFAYPLNEYCRFLPMNDEQVAVIPSLIHYGTNAQSYIGNEVHSRNLLQSPRTFQWMKRYISMRSPASRRLDDRSVSVYDAAEDFLIRVIQAADKELNIANEEVAFTVPVEAFEHYENWLLSVTQKAGLQKVRLIDEPSAAALGYSTRMFPEEACMVFDFGAGTLDVSIVKQDPSASPGTERCRVLGKAGTEIGGSTIDEWLYEEIISHNGYTEKDTEVQQISRFLLTECEALKEKLSFQEKASLTVMNPLTGAVISADYTRSQFENMLENKDAYATIDRTIRRALADSRERGFDVDDIKMVLMVGGCSQIPSIQSTLKRIFGSKKVKMDRPLDAVARGAASFIGGRSFDDYIQHDYAIRHRNSKTQRYEYRTLVKKGSTYPSDGPIDTIKVKATQNGQEEFIMQIFEIGDKANKHQDGFELFFDETGTARLNAVSAEDMDQRNMFWINERNRTLLTAKPPAMEGQERFEVSFSIDQNRRLLITTRDLLSGHLIHSDYPVVKLH